VALPGVIAAKPTRRRRCRCAGSQTDFIDGVNDKLLHAVFVAILSINRIKNEPGGRFVKKTLQLPLIPL